MRSFLSFVIAALLFAGGVAHADTCNPAGVVGSWTNGSATLSIQPSGNNFTIGLTTDGGNSSSLVTFNRQECSFAPFRSPGGRETTCRFESGSVYCSNPRQSNMRFERSTAAVVRQTPIPRPAPQQSVIRTPANQPQHASCVPELLGATNFRLPGSPRVEPGTPAEFAIFSGAFVGMLAGQQCMLYVIHEIRADGTATIRGARGIYTFVQHGRGTVRQGNDAFRFTNGRFVRVGDQLRLEFSYSAPSGIVNIALQYVNPDLLSNTWVATGGASLTGAMERVDVRTLFRGIPVAQVP